MFRRVPGIRALCCVLLCPLPTWAVCCDLGQILNVSGSVSFSLNDGVTWAEMGNVEEVSRSVSTVAYSPVSERPWALKEEQERGGHGISQPGGEGL